jgi:hypothetical protein
MIRPFGETRELVSLNQCGAEPSANCFLPSPSTTAPNRGGVEKTECSGAPSNALN